MDKNIDYKKDLAEKLEELKKIEGFPTGTDEDILALSQPPYYTACPNPYIKDFIEEYGKPYDKETDNYHREPYNGDVEEGKRHPMYMMHSYHTKVPHKAIIKYINHFTNEGDVILDAYSGSGMTGVAAQTCNRYSILMDLSPAATFISENNNISIFDKKFVLELDTILKDLLKEYSYLFKLPNGDFINYVIWSEVFKCPICGGDIVFWESFVNNETEKINNSGFCSHCGAEDISKRDLTKKVVNQNVVLIPVAASILKGKQKTRRALTEDEQRFLIEQDENLVIPYKYPITIIPDGYNLSQPKKSNNFKNVSDFYFKSSLLVLSKLWDVAIKSSNPHYGMFFCTSILGMRCTKRMPYRPKGLSAGAINNLSIPSLIQNYNPLLVAKRKFSKNFIKASNSDIRKSNSIISTQSATDLTNTPINSIDYIFTDPPFGSNIMYSDMNFIWESWLNVTTNTNDETIVNNKQNKNITDYNILLNKTFSEYYRILKPKRWITVEFNNSQSAIWNSIRDAITKSGFIISKVSILDKKLGSFKQVSSETSVDKDLVIFAFKPDENFEKKFSKYNGINLEMDFINQFISNIEISDLASRSSKVLYSKMIAFYIQRNYEIKLDAKSFYGLLKENFVNEDGFWFTTHQIEAYLEYKKKMKLEGMDDIKSGSSLLFVNDEKSALVWLYNFLSEPKTFSDISIAFNQLANIDGDEVPELKEIMEQNFISEVGKYRRPQNEAEHISITEKRQKNLKREFETLLVESQTQKGKIKLVRKEALAYGFELCYKEKRFADILSISKKLDKSILENSGELNDFVVAAEIMIEGIQ
jgi:DNA modification methylase